MTEVVGGKLQLEILFGRQPLRGWHDSSIANQIMPQIWPTQYTVKDTKHEIHLGDSQNYRGSKRLHTCKFVEATPVCISDDLKASGRFYLLSDWPNGLYYELYTSIHQKKTAEVGRLLSSNPSDNPRRSVEWNGPSCNGTLRSKKDFTKGFTVWRSDSSIFRIVALKKANKPPFGGFF